MASDPFRIDVFGDAPGGVRANAAAVLAKRAAYDGHRVLLTERGGGALRGRLPAALLPDGGLELFQLRGLPPGRCVVALAAAWDEERERGCAELAESFDIIVCCSGAVPKKGKVAGAAVVAGTYEGLALQATAKLCARIKGAVFVGAVPEPAPQSYAATIARAVDKHASLGDGALQLPLLGHALLSVPDEGSSGQPLWTQAAAVLEALQLPAPAKGDPPTELLQAARVIGNGVAAAAAAPAAPSMLQARELLEQNLDADSKFAARMEKKQAKFTQQQADSTQLLQTRAAEQAAAQAARVEQRQQARERKRAAQAQQEQEREQRRAEQQAAIEAGVEQQRTATTSQLGEDLQATLHKYHLEAQAEQERLQAEQAAAAQQREEEERLAAEQARLQAEQEQQAAAAQQREEEERQAAEAKQREEEERQAAEQERQAEEQQQAAAAAAEAKQREEEERQAAAAKQREEEERQAAEQESLQTEEQQQAAAAPQPSEQEEQPVVQDQASQAAPPQAEEPAPAAEEEPAPAAAAAVQEQQPAQPVPKQAPAAEQEQPAAPEQQQEGAEPAEQPEAEPEKDIDPELARRRAAIKRVSDNLVKRRQVADFVPIVNRVKLRELLQPQNLDELIHEVNTLNHVGIVKPQQHVHGRTHAQYLHFRNFYASHLTDRMRERGGDFVCACITLTLAEQANGEHDHSLEIVLHELAVEMFCNAADRTLHFSLRHWFLSMVWLLEHYLYEGDLAHIEKAGAKLVATLFKTEPGLDEDFHLRIMRAVMGLLLNKVETRLAGSEDVEAHEYERMLLAELDKETIDAIFLDKEEVKAAMAAAKAVDQAREAKEAFGPMAEDGGGDGAGGAS